MCTAKISIFKYFNLFPIQINIKTFQEKVTLDSRNSYVLIQKKVDCMEDFLDSYRGKSLAMFTGREASEGPHPRKTPTRWFYLFIYFILRDCEQF